MLSFFVAQGVQASEITVSKVIELVNAARDEEGLNELEENETLNKIAQDKIQDMIKNNYFAHTSPKGITPWSWYEKENYDYKYAGENLAINFLTAESQQKAWMNSPTHKKNIMNPQFLEIGVAVAAGEINNQMAIITVQEFGTLAGAGETSNKKENFSGKEKNNILKENQKIAPTVLSVKKESGQNYLNFGKNISEGQGLLNGYFSKIKDSFSKNKNAIFEYLRVGAVIALLLSLSLSAATFIAEALRFILALYNIEKISDINFIIFKRFRREENNPADAG